MIQGVAAEWSFSPLSAGSTLEKTSENTSQNQQVS